MERLQVQLTPAQAAALRRAARDRGVSASSLLREAADQVIQGPDNRRLERALAAVGTFRSGTTDTSTDHDDVLADAYTT